MRFITGFCQPLSALRHALLAWLAATCGLCVQAQTLGPAMAVPQVQSLNRLEAEQERLRKLIQGKPKAYVDNVMDPTTDSPQAGPGDALPDAAQAGFRGYVLETRMDIGQSTTEGLRLQSSRELGVRTEYRRETFNHGDFVLQADLRTRPGDHTAGLGSAGTARHGTGGRITLRNLGFPVTPDVFADTSLGDISSEITSALSRNYRLSLGSGTVRGFGMRVTGAGFDLRAGLGMRGTLAGGPYPGFQQDEGTLAWAGYSHRLAGNLYAGIQFNHATGVAAASGGTLQNAQVAARETVTSLAASLGYGGELRQDGDIRVRLTGVGSRAASATGAPASQALGLFMEGGLQLGGTRHEIGLYNAGPDLRFGDRTLQSDHRGMYWRMDQSTSRLSWGAGIDTEWGNPGRDPARQASQRTGLSANAQIRLDRDSAIGVYLNASQTRYQDAAQPSNASEGSRSLSGGASYQTLLRNWGRSRVNLLVRRNESLVANGVPATGEELQWEHDWVTGRYETLRPEFSTVLGMARDHSAGETQAYPTAGVNFRFWPDADWSVNGNLRYTSRSGNLSSSRGLSGSLNTEATLANGWRLGAALNLNQAVVQASLVPGTAPVVSRTNDKTAQLYLRWEGASGMPYQAAGLRNAGAAGGGGIAGLVYFDGNHDGTQQAGEMGVPGVEVFLDERYRVTTDREGRFEFPLVTTGRHQLSLTLETVPLPWGAAAGQGETTIEVPLRGTATSRIPVVRLGG